MSKRQRNQRGFAGLLLAWAVFLAWLPTNTSLAKANGLQQECVEAGLTMPQVIYAFMSHPGQNPSQTTEVKLLYDTMPEGCHGIYQRVGQYQIQLQDSKAHRRWFRLVGWPNSYYTADASGSIEDSNIANGHEPPWYFYRCTPGPKKTRVRLELRNRVKDLGTGQVIGRKLVKLPMKVFGAC